MFAAWQFDKIDSVIFTGGTGSIAVVVSPLISFS